MPLVLGLFKSRLLFHFPVFMAVALVLCLWVHPAAAGCATYASHSGITDGYYLQNGCTAIINNYSPCRVVTNSTGAELFVPSYYPAATSTTGQNEWNSFLAHPPAGVSVASCSCTLPWGGSLTPGQSVTAYQNSSEPCHGSCASQTRTCSCTDSSSVCVLSGSYTKQSCSVTACLPCTLPWGGTINDSQSVSANSTATVACGSTCAVQTRSCNNGTLSGSYTQQSCTVDPCPCSLPWGGSLASGGNVAAYNYASKACGGDCGGSNQQSRICSNGSLSGTYTNQSCSVDPCGCAATTYAWSSHCAGPVTTKNDSESETVSNTASGYTGAITASCSNGTWSYAGASCTANSCSLPWGGALASGSSVTAYAAASVPYGSSCASQARSCNNGALSGSYTNKTCTVQPAASCSLPWGGTLAHGASVTAYAASSVACGSSCAASTRTCNNGTLSGSGNYNACTVGSCGCGVTTYSWGSCQAPVPALTNGQSKALSYSYCIGGPEQTRGNVTVTCTNGSLVGSGSSCNTTFCFIPGTRVTMADGTTKPIRDLKVGDKVKARHGYNVVEETPSFDKVAVLYGFNGGKPFVTGGHPFWTNHGWAAVDPALTPTEHHNVKTTRLKTGDRLYLPSGKTVVVKSIRADGPARRHFVYDPQMSGDETYYANGYLVHNKKAQCGF